MAVNEAYIVPNHTGPTVSIAIEAGLCIGCNSCADICRTQTLLPNPEKGRPPVLAYPDECWYCGCCVEACPTGALQMRLPINQRVFFKDKDSGEVFRIGSSEAPAKTFFKPPYGWLDKNEFNGIWRALERKDEPVTVCVSDEACRTIGKYFGEKGEADRGGRLAAILRAMGFDKILRGGGGSCTVVAGGTEYELSARQLADMIRRGCVSSFTAVHTWRTVKEEEFDK